MDQIVNLILAWVEHYLCSAKGIYKVLKQVYLSIALLGIMGLVTMSMLLPSSAADENSVQVSPSPNTTLTANMQATVELERTAIARFTQSPELAPSMTPFFAQIIYNEVVRNLTEIPLPRRPCYLDPTDVPENPATPLVKCGPFIGTIVLNDQMRELTELMNSAGIEGYVFIESYDVGPIDDAGNPPYAAVYSRLSFSISVDTIHSRKILDNTAETVTDFILRNWNTLEFVSMNADIQIEFTGKDGSQWIMTTYSSLVEAKADGLAGESLIQALGGWHDLGN